MDSGQIETHPFLLRLRRYVPDLERTTLVKLFELANDERSIPSKRDIVVQGYPTSELFIVERGFAMRYILLHDGRRQVFSVIVPGDLIGVATFFTSSPWSVYSVSDMKV
jgi:CRP-like cAMP-binding protein